MKYIHSDLSSDSENSRCLIEDLKIGEAIQTRPGGSIWLRISTTHWLWRDSAGLTDCSERAANGSGILYDRVPPGTTITLTTV